jgi:hypothetical protein
MSEFIIEDPEIKDLGLFIGIAGGQGSGKTYSAMRMAKGIVGPGNKFLVIDTENKRASHYADEFDFKVINLEAPYSSSRYEGAVLFAYQSGYKAIVVDSASHEHDGYGGYIDSAETDLVERVSRYMKKYPNSKEYDVIEKFKPSAWIKPKKDRKRMMQTLLACSTSIPIIFCFRAEEKVFMSKDGKLIARQTPEWEPICGKGMPFEMTVSFMLHFEKPGYIYKSLKLPAKHASMFPLNKELDEDCGKRIAEWAKGGITEQKETVTASTQGTSRNITKPEWDYIQACLDFVEIAKEDLWHAFGVKSGNQLKISHFDEISQWINLEVDKRAQGE